jgi:hypothetical protein
LLLNDFGRCGGVLARAALKLLYVITPSNPQIMLCQSMQLWEKATSYWHQGVSRKVFKQVQGLSPGKVLCFGGCEACRCPHPTLAVEL